MIPGFETAVNITEMGFLLRTSIVYKFLSEDSCNKILNDFKNSFQNGNFKSKVKAYFEGKPVFADYGTFKTYNIESINFDKTPRNTEISAKSIIIKVFLI